MRSATPPWLVRAFAVGMLGACSLALAAGAGASADRVTLTVTPRDALLEQPVSISVSGLRPRSTVTLTASTKSSLGNVWISRATFRADAGGRVSATQSAPSSGSYRGRDGMGLFWSMRWGSRVDVAMLPSPVSTVRFTAASGGRTLATASLTRRANSPEPAVRNTSLAGEGFVGCYYAPPATTARQSPAILFIGGSNGGAPCDLRPALLASRGYPTLAIGYFGAQGLPSELKNIPLEYFETALRWLSRQPGVDPTKLVALGLSRGGECALLLGTVYPELIHGVVSYVGSSLVWGTRYTVHGPHDQQEPSWTLGGRPVPFATGFEDEPQAVIPVEKIGGPLFVVGAVLDSLWPSGIFANQIVARLRQQGRTDYTALVYRNAGHAVGYMIPNIPVIVDFGGTLGANARARADSWPKLLAFLERLR